MSTFMPGRSEKTIENFVHIQYSRFINVNCFICYYVLWFQKCTVKALFDFKPQEDNELEFKKGDLIEVIEQDGDWWRGRMGAEEGLFPANYVSSV